MSEPVGLVQIEQEPDTLPKLFMRNRQRWGDRVFMRKKKYGIWREYTWNECYDTIKDLSMGLISLGLGSGDKVSILGDSNPEWFWFQLATQAALGTIVGLVADNSPDEVKYMVAHSQSIFVIAQDQEQVDKVLGIKDDLPLVRRLIYWDGKGLRHYDDPILMNSSQLAALGKEYEKTHPGIFEGNITRGRTDDLYALQYTSGTTGLPKAAMMAWRTLFRTCENMRAANPVCEGDEWLSITLPAWGGGQMYGLFDTLAVGQKFNFAEETATIPRDIREVAPHRILYPSRMWEQLASTIKTDIEESTWLKRHIFYLGLPVGYKVAELSLSGRRPSPFWRALGAISELALFRALRDKHGLTRVRVPYTSGAMLAPDVVKFLRAIGLSLRQFYGSTEAGAISVHTARDFKLESVGIVAPGRTARIADNGEILADSEGAFQGYFKSPEATGKVLQGQWYHTGDAGHIDEDGHLVFLDRLEDMRRLGDGTAFSPQYIESQLKFSPFIKDSLVLGGQDWSFVGAMLNINFGNVSRWAERKRLPYTTFADLSQKPDVIQLLRREVETANRTLPLGARVKRFVSLPKEFDPDEAEMTRTRKLRRSFIEQRYRDLVNAMRSENGEQEVVMQSHVVYRDGRAGSVSTRVRVVSC
ncbi:MAG: AMP-binding protein [Chloroflexi bacterium]|nr:AMP-binding protein [Chloroflexota bacterium]